MARTASRTMAVLTAAGARMHDWLDPGATPGADPALALKTRDTTVHPGPFAIPELRRLSVRVPGLYVAALGAFGQTPVGEERRDVHFEFGATIFVRDGLQGAAITETLLQRIPFEQWGMQGLGGAADVRARNQFSAELADAGLTAWGITWTHLVRLGDPAIVDDPLPAHLTPWYAYEPDHGDARRYEPAAC